MTEFSPGAEIAGYRIESVIGRGGMAVVYRAEDSRLGRKVALKLLAPVLAQNQHFQQRFIRESRLAASLDHPNIVPIYEAGESEGHLFIAMRYVPGSDLKAVLAQDERLTPARLLRLFVQIGDALDAAHLLGLVHRDVKPGNILVSSVVEHPGHAHPDHVYLTDFGLTKRTSSLSGSLTDTGHFLGTVDYVSPEQIQGGPLSPATDTYALGCVLYESLTGQLPFNRDDDAAVLWAHLVEMPPPVTAARPDLPPAVDDVVSRAVAKSPEDRYDSCSDMMRDLEQALETVADLSDLPGAATGPAARHRRTSGAASAALPDELASSRSRLGTAPPPPVDPDATRAWVSHPSLPPGAMDPPRWPGPLDDATAPAAPTAAEGEGLRGGVGADAEDDDAYESHDAAEIADGDPHYDANDADYGDYGDYGDTPLDDYAQDQQAYVPTASSPAEPARARRTWLLLAAALAVLALVGALAVYFAQSKEPEPFATYSASSQESDVAFTIEHPQSWHSAPDPQNEFVIAPRATEFSDVFLGQAGWGRGLGVMRSSPDQADALFVTSIQTPLDPAGNDLQVWIKDRMHNSKVTSLTAPTPSTPSTIEGSPSYQLESTLSDVQSPATTLHAIFDVVIIPSKGTVLVTFVAPSNEIDAKRALFARMLQSLKFPG